MKQGNFENEEFIRVGTTLYKLVNQPRLNGGYVKKRIVWNNETLRQDYGKDYLATVPKYDGFCTVPDHVDYRPVVDKFLNLYEPIGHRPQQGEFPCIRSLVRPSLSILTLNANGLNSLSKGYRVAGWIKKQDPTICCLWET